MCNSVSRLRLLLLLIVLACGPLRAQRNLSGTPEIKQSLDRLRTVGSVLMIAAHPDDENTALLAYFARGRNFRTAYLSLTRGEGGQNLIGSELGDEMGVLRTQELLAARKIDGAEQFFTRAIDFGYSKTAEETLAKWGRETILADIVWTIRRFRPDVILLRFSGTSRDGHGHHQSSAILGREAFAAAADPKRFPEQLQWVKPWQAKRVLFNLFNWSPELEREAAATSGRLEVDTGEYNPVLGYSYGEIAGMSRSMHRSQGMGAAERRGQMKNHLVTVAGDPPSADPFDGIDTTWNRLPGGAPIGVLLDQAAAGFDPARPETIVPILMKARPLIAALDHPWAERKLSELDETAVACLGLWLDATADRHNLTPGGKAKLRFSAINRSRMPVSLEGIQVEGRQGHAPVKAEPGKLEYNRPREHSLEWTVPESEPYSQPYWLRNGKQSGVYFIPDRQLLDRPENRPVLTARFRLRVGSEELSIFRPVHYRYVDRVRGELTRPLAVVPPVSVRLAEQSMVFPTASPRKIEVSIQANEANQLGEVRLALPKSWKASPPLHRFKLTTAGQQAVVSFEIQPPAGAAEGEARAVAKIGNREVPSGMITIDYPHIPPQTLFPQARTRLVRADIRTLAKAVGYVMGAGDDVPESLRQVGCTLTLLGPGDLARGDLARFDAIVAGVRAYNTRPDLRANRERLMEYVKNGGTLVVQYNVLEGGFMGGDPNLLNNIGPYPMKIGRGRVSVEEAPVALPDPDSPLLQAPNRITPGDFEGWVQERGLYFASEWDRRYLPLFETSDPGEKPLRGMTLYTKYGKGAFVFTGGSWFRQLPAGVPGALRIFANLLSAGKTLK